MVLTPDEAARIERLEIKVTEFERLLNLWRAHGMDQVQLKSLKSLYAAIDHTH